MPVTRIADDNFSVGIGGPLESDTPQVGGPWVKQTGYVTGRIAIDGSGHAYALDTAAAYSIGSGQTNYTITMAIRVPTSPRGLAGPALMVPGTGYQYWFRATPSANVWEFYKFIPGSPGYQLLGSAAQTFTPGALLTVVAAFAAGSQTISVNGTPVVTTTDTDASIPIGTAVPGMIVGSSDASVPNFTVESFSVDATTAGGLTYTPITPGMLSANAYADSLTDNGSTYYHSSEFATLLVTTTATALSVIVHASVADSGVNARIGLRVNGIDSASIAVPALGTNTIPIDLTTKPGYAAGSNLVELIAGSQTRLSGVVVGTFLESIAFTGDSSPAFVAPAVAAGRVVVYGDSIASGAYALDASNNPAFMLAGWAPILRARLGVGAVLVEAYGGRSLSHDVTDDASAATFAAHLAAQHAGNTGAHRYWLAIGTNDYAGGTSAATFALNYARLLDAIQAADPAAQIHYQSPLIRTVETANAGGSTLDDFRAALAALEAPRPFTRYVNGKPILRLADIGDAAVHPTTIGQAKYSGYVAARLDADRFSPAVPYRNPSRILRRSRV